jgi:type IV pilus assembly protein PilB
MGDSVKRKKKKPRVSHSLEELTQFLSKNFDVPSMNLVDYEVRDDVIKLVPRSACLKHTILPVHRAGKTLIVAMVDPTDIVAFDDLKSLTGLNLEAVVASAPAILDAIERHYQGGTR